MNILCVPSPVFTDWSHITSQIGMFAFTGLQVTEEPPSLSQWPCIGAIGLVD